MHGSLEDHFLVIRIPWLNKVITYLITYLQLNKGQGTSHYRQRVTQAENELETNQNTRKGLVPSTFSAWL